MARQDTDSSYLLEKARRDQAQREAELAAYKAGKDKEMNDPQARYAEDFNRYTAQKRAQMQQDRSGQQARTSASQTQSTGGRFRQTIDSMKEKMSDTMREVNAIRDRVNTARDTLEAIRNPKEAAKAYAKQRLKRAVREAAKRAAKQVAKQVAAVAARTGLAAAAPYILAVLGIILAIILVLFLIIVIFIVGCNSEDWKGWITRRVSTAASWVSILPIDVCAAFSLDGGTGGAAVSPQVGGPPPSAEQCRTPEGIEQLRRQYGTAPLVGGTGVDDLQLTQLMSCIDAQLQAAGQPTTVGQVTSTYDRTKPLCNITRGDRVCYADCSHSPNSCHYGGRTGSQGALAVDYSIRTHGGAWGDRVVAAARQCGATVDSFGRQRSRCETGTGAFVSCTAPGATHVHISHPACDAN